MISNSLLFSALRYLLQPKPQQNPTQRKLCFSEAGTSSSSSMRRKAEAEGDEPALPPSRGPHIKKRALKNKALAVEFNEKDLKDYVSGFHKRKKKRRKEAQKQQEEVLRRKRIEARKKRKLEKEYVMYGGAPPPPSDDGADDEVDEEDELRTSTSATKVYETGDMQITVRTCEISRDEDDVPTEKPLAAAASSSGADEKKHNAVPVTKTKSFKKVGKQKPRRNSSHKKKRDSKSKGKKKNQKRR